MFSSTNIAILFNAKGQRTESRALAFARFA
jgi:hypothetical protein